MLCHESSMQNLQLAIFGQFAPQSTTPHYFPVHYTGHMHDDLSLRILYSAADAFVIPSRQDNFPNTALEAHACGTPVIAFNIGGLPDIVDDRVTGALADPLDSASLASAIHWVLSDEHRLQAMGISARDKAERLWNSHRVADLYKKVYLNALEWSPQP